MAGIALGIPNYLSIYFVLDALNQLEELLFFQYLTLSWFLSILSFVIYKEYLSKLNWSGIVLACISII